MPTTILTYDELASAWGVSREAARKKVEGLRLKKQLGNDGKTRVIVDLDEVQHRPLKRRPRGDRDGDRGETGRVIAALEGHVTTLKDMLAKAESAGERAGQERDEARRELVAAQAEAAYVPALRTTVDALMTALATEKDRNAELRDRLNARRTWWPFRRAG